MTSALLTQIGSLAAVVAGVLFVAIQFVHPADDLASVTTSAWAIVHYISLVMGVLFVFGITTIYASQAEKAGWIGFAGLVILSTGLFLTSVGGAIEAFVEPVIAISNPAYVEGMMATVEGKASDAVGVMSTVQPLASASFLVGTMLYGLAMFRAHVVPRAAALLFGFGLLLSGPLVAITGAYRLAAIPIGVGLLWMGYAVWSKQRSRTSIEVASPSP